FGRAEMFASKNGIAASACDAIGMGIGFTLALFTMGSVREIIGAGQWMGLDIPVIHNNPMLLFIMPAGGFFTLGMIIAVVNKLANRKPPAEVSCGGEGCEGCPMAESCGKEEKAE
ncbi:MAG TPA: electron transport complex subunit RsxE, partial [Ruminococcus sp.]|nr:electron transport complex subunit RsxE [Ruminococcus sp.]